MQAIFVLIMLTSYNSGAISHEFVGLAACENAGRLMAQSLSDKKITNSVAWVCAPKELHNEKTPER